MPLNNRGKWKIVRLCKFWLNGFRRWFVTLRAGFCRFEMEEFVDGATGPLSPH